MMKTILLATRNQGKLREIEALLAPIGIKVQALSDDAPFVEETGDTFEQNASLKAETIRDYYQMPVIADDSGLLVDVLGGLPGVKSARYASDEASDEENNRKLVQTLMEIDAFQGEVKARFVSVIAFARPNEDTRYFTGVCEGRIIKEPAGDHGFGYDPYFYVPEYEATFAELDLTRKNKISHRAKAMNLLIQYLEQLVS